MPHPYIWPCFPFIDAHWSHPLHSRWVQLMSNCLQISSITISAGGLSPVRARSPHRQGWSATSGWTGCSTPPSPTSSLKFFGIHECISCSTSNLTLLFYLLRGVLSTRSYLFQVVTRLLKFDKFFNKNWEKSFCYFSHFSPPQSWKNERVFWLAHFFIFLKISYILDDSKNLFLINEFRCNTLFQKSCNNLLEFPNPWLKNFFLIFKMFHWQKTYTK